MATNVKDIDEAFWTNNTKALKTSISAQLELPNLSPMTLRQCAVYSTSLSEWALGAKAWRRLAETARPETFAGDLATCLEAQNRGRDYVGSKAIFERFYPAISSKTLKKTAPKALGEYGIALLETKDMVKAGQLSQTLLSIDNSATDEAVGRFRRQLRIISAEQSATANPTDAQAMNNLARVLVDNGEFERGLAKYADSLKVDPNQQALVAEMEWATLRLSGASMPQASLEQAIQSHRATLGLGPKEQPSKDFRAWSKYAILLMAAARPSSGQDFDLTSPSLNEAIKAIRQCLITGRSAAQKTDGDYSYLYGYLSAAEKNISGFAYPEAQEWYVVLQSLRQLAINPSDGWSRLNFAIALENLDLETWSLEQVRRAEELLGSQVADSVYLRARIAKRNQDFSQTEMFLKQLLSINPLHPQANLDLAEQLAADGLIVEAAEFRAKHESFYGKWWLD